MNDGLAFTYTAFQATLIQTGSGCKVEVMFMFITITLLSLRLGAH
jgi:hypothetical protein